MENNKKKIVVFEDSEMELTKRIIDNSNFDVLLVRVNNYFRSSEEYVRYTENRCKVFNVDLFVRLDITVQIFETLYPKFVDDKDVFFINFSERGQYYAQELANKLKFKGCVLASSKVPIYKDKLEMKKFLTDNGIKTPEYHEFSLEKDMKAYKKGYILKARNSDSCRNIYDFDEILQMPHFDYSTGFLIEKKIEFNRYQEYATDIVIKFNKVEAYFVTLYPSPLIETLEKDVLNGNICLRHLTLELTQKLETVLYKLVSALDVSNGFIHLEFFYSKEDDDLIISEFGYRLGGGRMIKNYEEAFGISYYEILLGLIDETMDTLNIKYTEDRYIGDVYLPLNNKKGKIVSITDLDKESNFNILSSRLYFKIGEEIGDVEKTSFASFGNVVLEAETKEKLLRKMIEIKDKFQYEVI